MELKFALLKFSSESLKSYFSKVYTIEDKKTSFSDLSKNITNKL